MQRKFLVIALLFLAACRHADRPAWDLQVKNDTIAACLQHYRDLRVLQRQALVEYVKTNDPKYKVVADQLKAAAFVYVYRADSIRKAK